MSYTRTLLQLRTSFTIRGQYERSNDITPPVANELLNDALEETYNLLVERWDDYYTIVSPTFVTVAGTAAYALPTNFYKLRKVEILVSGVATDPQARWERLYPISVDDTHRKHMLIAKRYKYRLGLAQLTLVPVPQAIETLRVFYIPQAPQLTNDTDSVTFDTPVEQKLVLNIALRDALDRQDLPTADIEAKIGKLTGQLRSAADHDAGEPFYLGRNTGSEHEGEY
jgi:hypothetical protein